MWWRRKKPTRKLKLSLSLSPKSCHTDTTKRSTDEQIRRQKARILQLLSRGAMTTRQLADTMKLTTRQVKMRLDSLRRQGRVRAQFNGRWTVYSLVSSC